MRLSPSLTPIWHTNYTHPLTCIFPCTQTLLPSTHSLRLLSPFPLTPSSPSLISPSLALTLLPPSLLPLYTHFFAQLPPPSPPSPPSSLSLSYICFRALEASLAERQGTFQQLGLPLTGISVDPLNPHERKRQGHNPVGLKNIGNTCWFSAVIQVHVCMCLKHFS